MSYQVIARKWRPQTFKDLVGQTHVTETLANAINNDRVAHAYIFSGARGVGKTTAARILAKALNCVNGPTAEPCGVCDSCREIAAGTSLDVIEIDAASNRGIDQIRELREMVRYAPASSRSKVVILDEAHMLTGEASNALLKTLEEPPDRVTFVMATTEPENLVDTIRSRSQHFHFRALTFSEISARLEEIAQKENLKIDAGALAVIARMAEGSMRDALSLLEQARAYCGETIGNDAVRELLGVVPDDALAEMVAAIAEGSADRALGLIHTFQKEGRNLQHFCREAIRHMRNLLIAKVCGADSDLIAATADQRPALAEAAALFSEEDLTRFFQILLQTDDDLRRKPDPRVHLEMGLLRLINAARLVPLEELLTEIKTVGGGGTPSGAAGGPSAGTPARRAASASSGGASFATTTNAYSAATAAPAMTPSSVKTSFTTLSTPEIKSGPAERPVSSTFAPAAPPATDNAQIAVEIIFPAATNGTTESSRENENGAATSAGNLRLEGITEQQVAEIKSTVEQQQKFLSGLLEHARAWELSGAELKLYYSPDKKWCAEMLEGRDSLEKLRGVSSKVLGRPIRVCAKLEAGSNPAATSLAGSDVQELRARFEGDPMVRSLMQRFGGKISEVRRAPEE
jgi:DNA polymerase III subunit gamma/tau